MADTFRLRYGESAKPVLADRDGEVDTNWADGGTHVVTADATHAYTGTKSFKLAASGTGDFTTNYASLASGNNATFSIVAGNKYVVSIHTWGFGSTEVFQIKTGGVTSSEYLAPEGAWGTFHFVFTAVTATTALQIAIVEPGGGNIWFELEPIAKCIELSVLSARGMDEPDSFELFPAIQHRFLDGTMKDDIQAFRRKIRVECEPVELAADRKRVPEWMIDNDRAVDYLTEVNVPMSLADVGGFEFQWLHDISLLRAPTFDLLEPSVRTTWPV
jgi:hypothetical protein